MLVSPRDLHPGPPARLRCPELLTAPGAGPRGVVWVVFFRQEHADLPLEAHQDVRFMHTQIHVHVGFPPLTEPTPRCPLPTFFFHHFFPPPSFPLQIQFPCNGSSRVCGCVLVGVWVCAFAWPEPSNMYYRPCALAAAGPDFGGITQATLALRCEQPPRRAARQRHSCRAALTAWARCTPTGMPLEMSILERRWQSRCERVHDADSLRVCLHRQNDGWKLPA